MTISSRFCFVSLVCALLCLSGASVSAQFFGNSATGLSNPTTTLNFTEVVLADNAPLTNEYSAFGVEFTNVFYNSGGAATTAPNIDDPHIGNFIAGSSQFPTFSFEFTTDVTGASIALAGGFGGNATFTALLMGVIVGNAVAPIGLTNTNFYGFDNLTFDQFRVQIVSDTGNNAVIFDLLSFRTIPEPSTWAMAIMGLVLLAPFLRRLRRA